MTKFLIVIAVYLAAGYVVTILLILFSLLFWLFGLGDAGALFTKAVYTFFFTFVSQFLIFYHVGKKL